MVAAYLRALGSPGHDEVTRTLRAMTAYRSSNAYRQAASWPSQVFSLALSWGAIVGVTTTSPNEILRDFVVFVFAIIGAELGVAAALLGGSRWWLFRRFVRRSKHDDPGQAGHGRKGD